MLAWGQDLPRLVLFYLGLSQRNWLGGEAVTVLNAAYPIHCPDAEQVSRAVGLLVGPLVCREGCHGTVKMFWTSHVVEKHLRNSDVYSPPFEHLGVYRSSCRGLLGQAAEVGPGMRRGMKGRANSVSLKPV